MAKIYEKQTPHSNLVVEKERGIIILTSHRNNGMVEVVVLSEEDILEIAKKIKGGE